MRYPVEVGLVGDSGRALRGLLAHLKRNEDRSFLGRAQIETKEWWKLMEEQGSRQERPMKPQVVAWELGKRLSDTAIVASDSGTIATWFARQIPARRGQMYSLSGNPGHHGQRIALCDSRSDRIPKSAMHCVRCDGGFSMLMAEFATAVKYQLSIKVIIIKNNTLGMIKWEQMVFRGNPEFGCELQPIDFVAFAKAFGGVGMAIEDPVGCGRV